MTVLDSSRLAPRRHLLLLATLVGVAGGIIGKAAAEPQIGPEVELAGPHWVPEPAAMVAAAGASNHYLVAWAYGNDVAVRTVDAAGKLGPVRRLSNTGSSPLVAFNGTHFFVTWADRTGPILGQRLDSDGVPVDAVPFTVAARAYPIDSQGLACAPARCVYVSGLRTAANLSYVAAVRIAAAGTILDATPITVSSSAGSGLNGSVASDGTDFLITWVDTAAGVQARRLMADGTLGGSAPSLLAPVAQIVTNRLTLPVPSFDGSNYAVLWDGHAPSDQTTNELYFQRLDRTAVVLDATPIEIDRGNGFDYIEQRTGLVPVGDHWLAFWITRDANSAGYAAHIYSRTIPKAGGAPSSTVDLGPDLLDGASDDEAALVVDADGDPIAVWTALPASATNVSVVKALPLSADGTARGTSPMVVSEDVAPQGAPAAVWKGDGWLAVLVESQLVGTSASLLRVRISTAGDLVDAPPVVLATGDSFAAPRIGPLAEGFVIVWRAAGKLVALRVRNDGSAVDGTPVTVADSAGTDGPFRLLPLGSDALVIVELTTSNGWLAYRIRADGSVAPYDLGPTDPLFPPATSAAAYDATVAGGVPILAQMRSVAAPAATLAVRPLSPEAMLPASTTVSVPPATMALALGGGPSGALAAWIDSARQSPAFIRLSASGAALDAKPSYVVGIVGAPSLVNSADPAIALDSDGWLIAWRYSYWGSSTATPPLAVTQLTAAADSVATVAAPVASPATATSLSFAAGSGGKSLLLYQSTRQYLLSTTRGFARVVGSAPAGSADGGLVGPIDAAGDGGTGDGPTTTADARDAAPNGDTADAGPADGTRDVRVGVDASDASVAVDARDTSGGLDARDAPATGDAGTGAGRDAAGDAAATDVAVAPAGRTSSGCGCSTAPDHSAAPMAVLLAILATTALARRRARKTPAPEVPRLGRPAGPR